MITEPGPESYIKNRVDNKKINCMLVDKKVSEEKKTTTTKTNKKQNKQAKKLLATKIAAAVAK